jgi:hypothetical protein
VVEDLQLFFGVFGLLAAFVAMTAYATMTRLRLLGASLLAAQGAVLVAQRAVMRVGSG